MKTGCTANDVFISCQECTYDKEECREFTKLPGVSVKYNTEAKQ